MSFFKQLGLLILLVALAGGGYKAYEYYVPGKEKAAGGPKRRGGGPVMVETEIIRIQKIEDRIEAVGTTLAARAVEIVAVASGRIDQIHFTPGQKVKKGDILISLDDDIQRTDLTEAKARLAVATFARERGAALAKSNTVSRASIEQITADLAIAQAQLDRAERRLADRQVIAPFAGIAGLNRVEIGARIDDKTMITTLDDLSEVDIEFALPETYFGKIANGLPVKATTSAYPDQIFTGKIAEIDSRVDTVSRSFKVHARLPNQDAKLPAGMFMHLTIVLSTRENPMISEEAIIAEGNQTFVYTVLDEKVRRTAITSGTRNFGQVEVLKGLSPGDIVVVRGIQKLRNGAKIRLKGKGKPAKNPPANQGRKKPFKKLPENST